MKIRVITNDDGLYVNVADLIEVLRASGEVIVRDDFIAKLAEGAAGATDRQP